MVIKILKSATTTLGNEIQLVTPNEMNSNNNVLIIGVFHGDEPQGKYLIERYLKKFPLSLTLSHKGRGNNMDKLSGQWRENNPAILSFAKNLRGNMTDAEKLLWEILRANRFYGLKFKRQVPFGKYIVDFVCNSHKLIIELDGGQHNEPNNITADKTRTLYLEQEGYKVIRFWNEEIFNNLDGVCEKIIDSLVHQERDYKVARLGRGFCCSLAPCGRGLGRGGKTINSSRNLLFIPCLNPDGMQLGRRTNANGVDLNRNFPTKNWGEDGSAAGNDASSYFGGTAPASEIETQFVIDIIEEYKPQIILTLHAPYKVVNYDGPAKEIAEKISEIIKYPPEASIGYPTPGSFGTYCGVERNIPTITLELDEKIPVENLFQPVSEIFNLF